MKQSNEVTEAKNQNALNLERALNKRVVKVLKTKAGKTLTEKIESFIEDPYNNNYFFDEAGEFCSAIDLTEEIEALGEEERETINALVERISLGVGYFKNTRYEKTLSQCIGAYPTIYRPSAGSREYVIFSVELRLKVEKVKSEEHAMAIIEQAMRKAGVFENIVKVDWHGNFVELMDTKLGNVSDEELKALVDSFEASEDEV